MSLCTALVLQFVSWWCCRTSFIVCLHYAVVSCKCTHIIHCTDAAFICFCFVCSATLSCHAVPPLSQRLQRFASQKDDFLRLAINGIHNDLCSRNEAFHSLALGFVANGALTLSVCADADVLLVSLPL